MYTAIISHTVRVVLLWFNSGPGASTARGSRLGTACQLAVRAQQLDSQGNRVWVTCPPGSGGTVAALTGTVFLTLYSQAEATFLLVRCKSVTTLALR